MSLKGSPMLNTPAYGEHRAGYAKHPKNQNATWKLTIERPCSTAATSSLLLVSPCSPRLCSFSPFSLREATSYFRRCFTAVPRSRPRLRPAGPGGSRSSMPATSTALQKPAPSARGPLWPQQFLSPQSGSRHGGFISFKDCGWAEIIQYHHNRCVATFETSLHPLSTLPCVRVFRFSPSCMLACSSVSLLPASGSSAHLSAISAAEINGHLTASTRTFEEEESKSRPHEE